VKVRNLMRNGNVAVAVYRGEAVIIRGRAQLINSDEEFSKITQEYIDKYRLKLDEHGRDSLETPLFNTKIRCIIEVTPKRILF